jgi:hypothetical protein
MIKSKFMLFSYLSSDCLSEDCRLHSEQFWRDRAGNASASSTAAPCVEPCACRPCRCSIPFRRCSCHWLCRASSDFRILDNWCWTQWWSHCILDSSILASLCREERSARTDWWLTIRMLLVLTQWLYPTAQVWPELGCTLWNTGWRRLRWQPGCKRL